MAQSKEQGRYARMAAFWGLTLLVAYGCLGGLRIVLGQWIGGDAPEQNDPVLIESLPLFDAMRVSTLVAIAILLVAMFAIHRFVNRPKSAALLADTETEMRKVTWPNWSETWNGTLAVVVTVIVLFFYLTVADAGLLILLQRLMGVGA